MRTCNSCGAEAADDARFCANCGAPFASTCTACGAELPPGARFCPSCAAPVEPVTAAGEERKVVTVLFADVTGSTGLGERLDPERFRDVMSSYFEAMRREIEAEGGTVEKFIGDAVMAAFGVPTAHEDDPSRALRAALRMQRRLEEVNDDLRRTHDVALAIRIGVNTGEVVATASPKPGEGMVSGDAVNVAARLEQAAEPGHVVVSERTARATRGFRFHDIGALSLKGKGASVHAFELIEEQIAPERGIPGISAPMVGRDRELALLETVFDRVAEERSPHLVTIYGDAGVGKSRLVTEFLSGTESLARVPVVLRGRCLPYGDGVTYWPLAEILKGHAGVLDTDPPDLALEKIRKAGRDLFRGLSDDPERPVAALAYTVGIEHPEISFRDAAPRQVRAETHAAWRSFFSALSQETAVVVVIEDIHWADPAMLDLLQELADKITGATLLLCPSRPELTARRPDWGGGRRNFSSVSLEPLSEADADRLITMLLSVEDLPETVHRRILERAEGNPFFLEEIIRQLIDAGRIVRAGDRWRAVSEIEDVVIPDTVQAVLAARIDLLSAEDKHTLQLAAVVGRVFWPGPVRQLLNGEAEHVEDVLDRLEDRELVTARMGSAMAGEREFIFKHVLTRDVAYESLPRRDRAEAHAAVARWIEETAGERRLEFVELLAYHSAAAYGIARERGASERVAELRRNAFDYLLTASTDARSKLASQRALGLAEQALEIAETDVERARSFEAMGLAAQDQYEGDEAWRYLRQAADARAAAGLETAEDKLELAMLCARACETPTRWPGSMREVAAQADVRRYLELGMSVVPRGDNEPSVRLLAAQAFWPWAYSEIDDDPAATEEARAAGDEAASIAIRIGRPDLASAALDGVGAILMAEGRFEGAKVNVDRRIELLPGIEDPLEIGDILSVAAWTRVDLGLNEEAIGLATRGLEGAVEDAPSVALHSAAWKAVGRMRLGAWKQFDEDFSLVQRLLGDRRDDPPYFASTAFGAAALVYDVRGQRAAADRMLDIIAGLGGQEAGRGHRALAYAALVQARRGDFDPAWSLSDESTQRLAAGPIPWEIRCDIVAVAQAWARADEVLATARAITEMSGARALPAFIDRLEGRRALGVRDYERAAEALGRARDAFGELRFGWDRAWTELALGEALFGLGQDEQASAELQRASAVFEDLGARAELERARELLDR